MVCLAESMRGHSQVISALRHCFQNDSVGFLDEARFTKLLPLLVSQLSSAGSPDGISLPEAEAQDCGRDAPDGERSAAAAAEALIRMVSAVKDNALWQIFNRQVGLGCLAHKDAHILCCLLFVLHSLACLCYHSMWPAEATCYGNLMLIILGDSSVQAGCSCFALFS